MELIKREKAQFDKRIHEIDLFRGFLILLVIFDHLMWFFNYYIFHNQSGALNWYWQSEARFIVRQVVLMAFLFTCGISCHLSRNNKKRGTLLALLCIGITIATHLLQLIPLFNGRVVIVDFNILGVVALSILLYCIFEKRSNVDLYILVGALFIFYIFLLVGNIGNTDTTYYPFRSILYTNFNLTKEGYVADYLTLFPYVIFLFLGVLFARKYYPNKESLIKHKGNWERAFCFMGRHTLLIYVAHEVLFTLIFMLIGLII